MDTARRNKQSLGQGRDQTAFPALRLLGDRLCLDFANTIESPLGDDRHDYLASYADLVRWSRHSDLLTDAQVERALAEVERRPADAAATFDRAIALRGSIYRLFRAVARGETPPTADIAALEQEHRAVMDHARLLIDGAGYRWQWVDDGDDLDRILWPIVRSAVDVLTAESPVRVKECPGTGDCGWLFFDTSKNGTRRWCSMEGCGSRAKMRRQYARQRVAKRGRVSPAAV